MHRPSPTTAQEITATYSREKSGTRRDQWAVHQITVVGGCADERLREGMEIEAKGKSIRPGEKSDQLILLREGCEYVFTGSLNEEEFRGKKRLVLSFVKVRRVSEPSSRGAIIRYLEEAPGVGGKTAAKIYGEFGSDSVRVLREDPQAVVAALATSRLGFNIDKARTAADHLERGRRHESISIELTGMFDRMGFRSTIIQQVIAKWDDRAPEIIRNNPFVMMDFKGCGFQTADKLYSSLGLPLNSLVRLMWCAWHKVHHEEKEQTWVKRFDVAEHIRRNVGGVRTPSSLQASRNGKPKPTRFDQAIHRGVRAGLFATYTDESGVEWIADKTRAGQEKRLADVVLAAMDEENPWGDVLNAPGLEAFLKPLLDSQRAALLKVLRGGAIGILGGGPGTGKTFTAAALMRVLVATFGAEQIVATAFTGKAARRFTEGMQAYQIPVTAVTTHSLLKVKNFSGDNSDSDDSDEQSEFSFNRNNPLKCKLIVVDEVSMNSTQLLLAILEARPKGCGVLLIGDVNQLPPIEHGAPLRDLIAAGLPYGELTETQRNAGAVVELCEKIRTGRPISSQVDFVTTAALDIHATNPRNIAFRYAAAADTETATISVIKEVCKRWGFDPVWDCQVIVAGNDLRKKLSAVLQREFNATAEVIDNCRFRVSDKAMQNKNMSYKLVDDDGKELPDSTARVANGEFAKVLDIQEKRIVAQFFLPDRRVSIPRFKEDGLREEGKPDGKKDKAALPFDLGLAATCHKMQGSQAKCVIVVLESAYGQACEWFLTAISRMEKACVCVGDFTVIQKMVGKRSLGDRKTFLKEEIESGRLFGERVWWVEQGSISTELVTK